MIFRKTQAELEKVSAYHTANEINQQPKTWLKTLAQIHTERENIEAFISNVTQQDDFDVIFTGAGTSEFVGSSVFSHVAKFVQHKAKSYGTTDILSSPTYYLHKTKPTLIVSFARSGNSPESVAVVNLANQYCENVYHLFVTCNKEGALSKIAAELPNAYALNLADETHDQSFVMTSSFSNMALATLLIFDKSLEEKVSQLAEAGSFILENEEKFADIVNKYNFGRIVYLGANTIKGVSQESALKMLELTAGKVVVAFDTPLGFRHGPKSIISDDTLVLTYISNDEYAKKYEVDLVHEMSRQRKENKLMVLTPNEDLELNKLVDFSFNVNADLPNALLGIAYIVVAQLLAYYKALSFEITPDNPCPTGEVNRVVQGVIVHEYKGE